MHERESVNLEEQLFANLDEKLERLKNQAPARAEILEHIRQDQWDAALALAGNTGIDLFSDRQFSKEAAAYWQKATGDARRIRDEAQQAIEAAQAAIGKMQEAKAELEKHRQELASSAAMTQIYLSLTRADQALLKLGTDAVQREILAVQQRTQPLPPEVALWLSELEEDVRHLERGGYRDVATFVKNHPRSRLALLQNVRAGRGGYAQPEEVSANFKQLATGLYKGDRTAFDGALAAMRQYLNRENGLDAFQQLVYRDSLAIWEQRAGKQQDLLDATRNLKDFLGTGDRPSPKDPREYYRELRSRWRWLNSCIHNTPAEVLVTVPGGNESMAQSARGIFTLGTARLMAIRKQLRLSHEWDTYQEHVLALLVRKEEEGRPFFRMYGIDPLAQKAAGPQTSPLAPAGAHRPSVSSGIDSETATPSSPATVPLRNDDVRISFARKIQGELRHIAEEHITISLKTKDGQLLPGESMVTLQMVGSGTGTLSANNSPPATSLRLPIVNGTGTFVYRTPDSPAGRVTIRAKYGSSLETLELHVS